MLRRRDATEMSELAVSNLTQNTDITYFGGGSIIKTLIDTMAIEIERLYDSVDLNISQARLSTSSGAFLDIIAGQYGITRFGGTTGTILAEDEVVRFYVSSGKLADYLPSSTPSQGVIPQGTTIQNRRGTITYETTTEIAFPLNIESVFVGVQPKDVSLGTANNVASFALSVHDLGVPQVLVENVSNIVVGSDPETDSELRLRISRRLQTAAVGSRASVVEAVFSFPGISDVKVLPYKHGAGSFELLVVPTSTRVSPNVIANIKSAVDTIVPYGIRVSVRQPEGIPIALSMQLIMHPGSLSGVKSVAAQRVKRTLQEYLGSIPMGGQLIINQIRALALEADNRIRDLKIVDLNIGCRPRVISNYQLRPDEVFVLDIRRSDPLAIV